MNARGPGAALPYTDAIAPDSAIDLTALLAEPPRARKIHRPRHAAWPTGRRRRGNVRGRSARGRRVRPVRLRPPRRLVAGRRLRAGAADLAERRLAAPARLPPGRRAARPASLPGALVPALPPVSGVLDGDLAGGGTPGQLRPGRHAARARAALPDLRAGQRQRAAGRHVRRRAALGHRAGRAAGALQRRRRVRRRRVRAAGRYDGTLAGAAPVHRRPEGQRRRARAGPRHPGPEPDRGPDDRRRRSPARRCAGWRWTAWPGTIAIEGKSLRVVAADGSLGGGRVVAEDAGGPFLVSAPDLPVAALRGAGLPLQAGRAGAVRRGRPARQAAALRRRASRSSDGLARGLPDQRRRRPGLRRQRGAGAQRRGGAGRDLRLVRGRRGRGRAPRRWPTTSTPACRWATWARCGGCCTCRCARSRAASRPTCGCAAPAPGRASRATCARPRARTTGWPSATRGPSSSPRRARSRPATARSRSARRSARVDDLGGAAARSRVDVRAERRQPGRLRRLLRRGRDARRARAGVAFALANDGRTTRTTGRVDVSGLRFRRFPFGTTDANWSQRGGTVDGALAVRSAHGSLRAGGTVVPAAGDLPAAFARRQLPGRGRRPGDRPGHLAAAVRPDRADPGPGRRARQRRRAASRAWASTPTRPCATARSTATPSQAAHAHARSDGARIALADTSADLGFAQFGASGSFGLGAARPAGAGGPRPDRRHRQGAGAARAQGPLRRRAARSRPTPGSAARWSRRAPRWASTATQRPLRLAGDPAHPGQRRLRRQHARGARRRSDLPQGQRAAGRLAADLAPAARRARARAALVHARR